MDNYNSNFQLVLQAKEEYTNQFINITSKRFIEGFQSIYDNVKNNNEINKKILREFQESLKIIPLWNDKIIEEEYNRIKLVSKCDYLDNLIERLFISIPKCFY